MTSQLCNGKADDAFKHFSSSLNARALLALPSSDFRIKRAIHIFLPRTQALQHLGALAINPAQLDVLRAERIDQPDTRACRLRFLDGRSRHAHRSLLRRSREFHIHKQTRAPYTVGLSSVMRAGAVRVSCFNQGAPHIGHRACGLRSNAVARTRAYHPRAQKEDQRRSPSSPAETRHADPRW